jgi:sodium-dependent dicarboxylate transporter 2/3/5
MLVLMLVTPAPEALSSQGWRTAGVAALMAVWWITEAIPIPVTALLPLALFPILGLGTIGEAATPYANPIIFLFLGGFILAAGLTTSGLHRRLALSIIRRAGQTPVGLTAGFMVATALLSMWVSNTATVMMMLPIAVSTLALVDSENPRTSTLSMALLLGIAYAANIGGLATLIGTPPNALLAGFMEETYGVTIGFARWMTLGLPLVAVALPLCWILLVRVLFPVHRIPALTGIDHVLGAEPTRPLSRKELVVAVAGAATALAWMFRPLLAKAVPGISDAGIAIAGAMVLFLLPLPVGRHSPVLQWRDTERLPWGILLLFGGGISLAAAIQRSGLAEWIGAQLSAAASWPFVALVAAVTAVVVLITEITSNTATAATFLPVVAALAVGIGMDPLLLAAPAALAASCAFMLPVATPPNAIVYASDRVPMAAMIRAGIVLNLLMIALITLMVLGVVGLWGTA